ncbi:histidine phosphatase superfamily [Lophiotrema nucula]|uniref:Histidine phosphatase superfamily n=1 Tax=Lophiotrema nucula TaxID=690887 RepID=A0A6A5YLY4_9PLEO|nr:histidine phosphatase superfamily [Lophiotrema nucula]
MSPTLYLVRHAEGYHNVDGQVYIRDAVLTPNGRSQCANLQKTFPDHDKIDLVLSSPMRRTIQTAVYSFAPTLARKEVPYLVIPKAQEVSRLPCDVGHDPEKLKVQIKELVQDAIEDGFDVAKIDLSAVEEGWNSKKGYWASEHDAVRRRAADLRSWLFKRPEERILLVTHGAFLHYLTEDWTGDDPSRGTAYLNCEVRQFVFANGSSAEAVHIVETDESRQTRGASHEEDDTHILEEIRLVESNRSSNL